MERFIAAHEEIAEGFGFLAEAIDGLARQFNSNSKVGVAYALNNIAAAIDNKS